MFLFCFLLFRDICGIIFIFPLIIYFVLCFILFPCILLFSALPDLVSSNFVYGPVIFIFCFLVY